MFKKGDSKPVNSGRKKGSLNKKTLLSSAVVLANRGINPTDKLIELIPSLEPKERAAVWKFLAALSEPKKSVADSLDSPTNPQTVPESVVSTAQLLLLKRNGSKPA